MCHLEVEVHWYLEYGKPIEEFFMPFGVIVVEVPLLVGHMVVFETVVVEVLVALFVTTIFQIIIKLLRICSSIESSMSSSRSLTMVRAMSTYFGLFYI